MYRGTGSHQIGLVIGFRVMGLGIEFRVMFRVRIRVQETGVLGAQGTMHMTS